MHLLSEIYFGMWAEVATKEQTALTVGRALAVTCLSLAYKDNSHWMDFFQCLNLFGKLKVCDQLLTGEGSVELFIFGSSSSLTQAPHMALLGKMYKIPYCFTPIQLTCYCFPVRHSCVKGLECYLMGCIYKLNSITLLSRTSITTFRETV